MPVEIKDAPAGSSTAPKGDSSSTSGGNQTQKSPDQLLAEYKAENERKQGEISTLRSGLDEVNAKLARFEEIEEKRALSAREEAERRKLEKTGDSIETRIESWRKELLRANPDAENWFTDVELKLAKATKMASTTGANEALLMLAADYLEETAEELAETEEFKGMTEDKLLKLIRPFMGQFETKSPILKTKKAIKAWKADIALRKEKSEAKKKADEGSQEGDGRNVRETSTAEIMGKKNLDINDKASLREKLGIVQRQR